MSKMIMLNDLFDYGLKIYQYNDSFRFSLDSILLAEYINIKKTSKNILDICSGNASIPLILSTKTNAHIDGVEIQEDIAKLGNESIKYNHLDKQITLYNNDIKNHEDFIKNKKYDIITCNPPYFKIENDGYINMKESLAISRHEIKITLEEIFLIASSHLDTKGEFYLVHRVNRLDEIIIFSNKYKLPVKDIMLISTKNNNIPYILLVRCVKNALPGVKVKNKVCLEGMKSYQGIFKEVL